MMDLKLSNIYGYPLVEGKYIPDNLADIVVPLKDYIS